MVASKRPSWLHMIGFALSLAATVFMIYDIEFPRSGLIRVDQFDQVLVNTWAACRISGGAPSRAARPGGPLFT